MVREDKKEEQINIQFDILKILANTKLKYQECKLEKKQDHKNEKDS